MKKKKLIDLYSVKAEIDIARNTLADSLEHISQLVRRGDYGDAAGRLVNAGVNLMALNAVRGREDSLMGLDFPTNQGWQIIHKDKTKTGGD